MYVRACVCISVQFQISHLIEVYMYIYIVQKLHVCGCAVFELYIANCMYMCVHKIAGTGRKGIMPSITLAKRQGFMLVPLSDMRFRSGSYIHST